MIANLKFRGELLPHQQAGVEWVIRTPKGVLADEVGLGKTAQALGAIARLSNAGALPKANRARSLCRVLWVTEASLLAQTKGEVELFLPDLTVLTGLDPEMASGPKASRRLEENYPDGVDLLILSYETVHARREWLNQQSPGMLVLDEVSSVKGGGKHFSAVRDLARKSPRVLAMTATPMENDPTELWSVLSAADVPRLWPEDEFNRRFVTWRVVWVDRWGKKHEVPSGWHEHRLAEVKAYLPDVLLRRTHVTAQLAASLPVRIGPRIREVPLTPEQEVAYEKAQKASGLDAVHRMEAASLMGGANPPMVVALVEELRRRPGQQAIVYCEALGMLDVVERSLTRHNISTCRIEGKVTASARREAVAAHRAGHSQVLLASRVLEYGLNLQHCRLLFSLDTSWNPARERQREGRLRRMGSPHQTYEHLVIRPGTPLAAAKAAKLGRKVRNAELVGLA